MKESLAETIAPGWLPPGLRVYAIGDVHGCADRLAALHRQIAADLAARPVAGRCVLLHLGDYVDRGPDSRAVLDLLLGPSPVPERVTLVGNHEVLLLAACDPAAPPDALPLWLRNGGAGTLASYGADPAAADAWRAVPERHLALLRGLPLRWAAGGYLFVHAGIRPGVPLDQQDPQDLIWIREPFLSHRGPLPLVVVHGHTPIPAPVVRDNRIGIDTGACYGGDLTCVALEGTGMRFFTA